MIVEKREFDDTDGSLGWIECIYNSTNLLLSIYFPKSKKLYLSFNRGETYKYLGIDQELYDEFESAESQGKFFNTKIKKGEFRYSREYKLYENELKRAKQKIVEWKENH